MFLARQVVEKIVMERGETIRKIGFVWLGRRGFQEEDLEDFVQDTYMRVLQGIRPVQTPEEVHAFTDTVARNLAKDMLRKPRETVDENAPEPIDKRPPIDTLLVKEEQRKMALAAAEFLKPNAFEAVVGRLNGESDAQIAARLDVKVETVRSYIHRSVPRIQEQIKEHGRALISMGTEKRKERLERECDDEKKKKK